MKPSVGRVVHYVARGSKDGVFPVTCRAAIITEVVPGNAAARDPERVGLAVLNPDGALFARDIRFNETAETPGDPNCPDAASHGTPMRYCPCGWIEAAPVGGTWHWPERVE